MASSRDYTDGRIYKILNYNDDACYVGSTCLSLSKRMGKHREDANNPKKQHWLLYIKMKEYGIENFYIELIEAYPCKNSEELRKREGHFIREFGTLNKNIAGRTPQEYGREYRQNNLTRRREYYQNNRDRMKKYYLEYCQNNRDRMKNTT